MTRASETATFRQTVGVTGQKKSRKCNRSHLEVKDADVAVREALAVGDHAVEEVVVQRERGDGGQQPAVPCGHTSRGFVSHRKAPGRHF